ncbi:MAG: sulfotransferase family 2 domain-containing protein, partial [Armatimonadota bacterium]
MPKIINYLRQLSGTLEPDFLHRFRCLGEWGRIYHLHVRKTGGTSLNYMFIALASPSPQEVYRKLCRKPSHSLTINGAIYTGWDKAKICKGDYFYAFSHHPLHRLRLPASTFAITCFRDPVERVVSLYQMLSHYRDTGVNHPCMAEQGPWLG